MLLLLSRIWFLLYDASTSLPYVGTKATSAVSLPPGSLVVDFRKAAKTKHANKLSYFDADELIVYKNKLSFDKRNVDAVAGKKGMGKPLEEDSLVDGLGTSIKEALIVVVPSLSQVLRVQPKSTAFPPCQKPFFKSICDATERDGWISFGHNIPGTSLNKLYIRECYQKIASNIYPDVKKSIITGTPGIGKSLFLIYLLWTLVKEEGKRVLFIYHSFNIYYDGKGGVFEVNLDRKLLDPDESFWNDTLWCLLNAKGKSDIALNPFPCDNCKFVLSTTPRRELVNDFKKSWAPPFVCMPLWTEAELEVIAPSFPHAIEWRNRFAILGGNPRYVLEVTTQNPTEILENACKGCSLDDCLKYMDTYYSEITEKSKVTHLVLLTSVEPNYTKESACFASPTALDIIVEQKTEEARLRMDELILDVVWYPIRAAFCARIFETYVIELLEKGGTFTCRQLVDGYQNANAPSETLHIPPSTSKIVVDKVERDQTRNILHVPNMTRKNHPAAPFDAWIPGIGAFQMTVLEKPEINDRAKEDLATLVLGGEPAILYWCLPPFHYRDFTKKSPKEIEQYAIRIPYPANLQD